MAKVLLVEDDNNLREIYEARLQAEGYDIVSARDGEEALVVAKAEKPDLVISDVMMPKISGFEMLDILRNTDELKDVKVIMLTALGQSDDQQRADRLGADRYLVKSQVTLEDIVNVAHSLLNPEEEAAPVATPAPVAAEVPAPAVMPVAAEPSEDPVVTPAQDATTQPSPAATTTTDEPAADEPVVAAQALLETPAPAVASDSSATPTSDTAAAEPANDEAIAVETQIENFVAQQPTEPAAEVAPATEAPEAPEAAADTSPAASDDRLMADAINKLVANTEPEAGPIAPPLEPSTAPVVGDTAPEATAEPANSLGADGKKTVSPLPHEEEPNLASLLAAEDAKDSDVPAAPVSPEPAPAPVTEPAPASEVPVAPAPTEPGNDAVDPNSIAL